jgi:hypothetical protein
LTPLDVFSPDNLYGGHARQVRVLMTAAMWFTVVSFIMGQGNEQG